MENIDLEKISVAVGDDVFLKYKDEIIYRATSMIDMLTRHKISAREMLSRFIQALPPS